MSQRLIDVLLGFAAGVMLAASFFSLIIPGLDAARLLHGSDTTAAAIAVAGVVLGAVCIAIINEAVPHEHFVLGREGPVPRSPQRIWLFVLTITIHNLPEGLAVGGRVWRR